MASARRSFSPQDLKNETLDAWEKVKLKGEEKVFHNSMYTLMNSADSDVPVNGCIIVSNYRFFFHAFSRQYRKSVFYTSNSPLGAIKLNVDLPLGAISDIRKQTTGSNIYGFDLVCKDFRPILRFRFGDGEKKLTETPPKAPIKDPTSQGKYVGIIACLQKYVFCDIEGLFAFKNKEELSLCDSDNYDLRQEYERLGLLEKSSEWQVIFVNFCYKLILNPYLLQLLPVSLTPSFCRDVS